MPDGKAEAPPYKPVATSTVPRWCVSARCRRNTDNREPRPAEGRPSLCPRCQDRLDQELRALPQLYIELEQARNAVTRTGAGEQAPGVPMSPRTVRTRATIRSVLASWAQLVVDERNVARPTRSVVGMAEFLRRHVDWLGAQPAAEEVSTEISELTGAALQLIHTSPPPRDF